MRAFWISAFLDLAPDDVATGAGHWAAVTGYDAAAVADPEREFPPLQPPDGAPYLWVQRVDEPPSRVHLDVHVRDIDAAVDRATGLGAKLLARRDHAVLRSPSGFVFCLVSDAAGEPPPPTDWPAGHTSRLDRVRLFVPASAYDEECRMWEALEPIPARPLDVVVERGAEARPSAVLEVGTSDRRQEVERHVALGARVVGTSAAYDELIGPAGIWYRVADREH